MIVRSGWVRRYSFLETKRERCGREESMRAVVVLKPGGVENLAWQEVETPPPPTADRVRVRVRAAGVNRADMLQRAGKYPPPPGYPTDILGLEFAGEVESLGEAVGAWQIGARVFGITAGGGQAEFVVVPESNLARIPDTLDYVQAAAMPEVFITAHDALFTRARLQMGERVLIHAAASGVGTAAVQLAHATGAFVYGTSRTAAKLEQVRALGLDQAITVEGASEDFVESVQRLTDGAGVDVVLDLVGGDYFPANLRALASGGRIICVGTTAGREAELDLGLVLRKRATIIGTVLRARSIAEKAEATRLFAAHVLPLVARGLVRPVVDRVYPAAEVRAAHEYVESNRSCGKVVLDLSGSP
ncbi:MAG: NAD(P)H-quinone oxidoreductase [Spartobacteria bacterium]